MKTYRVSFIVEQEYYQNVQANSKEEAYEKFVNCAGWDSKPTSWSEIQSDSCEIEEVTNDN